MSIWGAVKSFFSSNGSKGIIEQVSETAERWKPSPVKEHEMNLEQLRAEDASQASARTLAAAEPVGEGLFNRIVTGINRLPRPVMAFWAIGQLTGVLPVPEHLNHIHPLVLNIIWTIIGFYFGVRTISQDLPALLKALRK